MGCLTKHFVASCHFSVMDCPVDGDECDDEEDDVDEEPKGCTEAELLDGSCPEACPCSCGSGLGVLVDPVPGNLDCDKPTSVCMNHIVAYEFVLDHSGAWYVYLYELIKVKFLGSFYGVLD